ncbi:MAG: peptidase U37 [Roseibium sp.]|nr:peptidase U37 [Roseibium sp.]
MPTQHETIRLPKLFGDAQIRVESFDAEDRTVEVIWSTGSRVKRYSFSEGFYMEELSMDPSAIRLERFGTGMSLLDSHDNWTMESRLGTVVPGSAKIENGIATAVVKLSRNERGERLFQDLQDGHPFPVSVGYRIHRYEKSEGDDGELPTLVAVDWEPLELSAVPIPADAGAHSRSEAAETYDCLVVRHEEDAANAALKHEDSDMPNPTPAPEGNDAARQTDASANPPAQVQPETRNDPAPAAPPATTSAPAPTVDVAAERADATSAERERVATITSEGHRLNLPTEMTTTFISDGTSVSDFRAAVVNHLAAEQEKTPTFSVAPQPRGAQDEVETRRESVVNALEHRLNPGVVELTEAGKDWRGMTLKEIAKALMAARGEDVRGMTADAVARAAFHATGDFPIVMEQLTNRTLRRSYDATPQTFRPFCRQITATDFKDMHRIQLGEVGDLTKVNEHGEFESTTLGEGKESFRIATYGRIIGITRQAVINDDLGVFSNLASKFGNAVSRLESKTVWDIIVNNQKLSSGTALFHSSHNNLGTGAGSALSETSISAGRKKMAAHKDIDERDRLGIRPRFLLLPTELEVTAAKLLGSFAPTRTDDIVPDFVKSLTPIVEDRLSDISATNWHLVADPNQVDTIEYAYLEGNEGPYTETRVGFEVDGMEVKVRLDFGAAPIDYRGFYRANGA